MKQKNVRFEYYQVVFEEKNEKKKRDRLFDLVRWINKANGYKTLESRTYDFFTEKARLETAYYDDEMKYYFLHFVRLGDNIPSKGKLNGKVEPLELADDEFIGNEITALYDENQHILMLQRNRASLGPSGVEFYLNQLWNDENEVIYLRPIAPRGVFEGAKKANHFKKIRLRFADIDSISVDEGASPLLSVLGTFGKYSGVAGEIYITSGRSKEKELNPETMIETIEDILANKETGIINKAEIHYKYTDDTAVEIVDLFAKIAHDFGQFPMEKRSTLSHFAIAEKMWNLYHNANKRNQILKYLMKE